MTRAANMRMDIYFNKAENEKRKETKSPSYSSLTIANFVLRIKSIYFETCENMLVKHIIISKKVVLMDVLILPFKSDNHFWKLGLRTFQKCIIYIKLQVNILPPESQYSFTSPGKTRLRPCWEIRVAKHSKSRNN